MKTIIMSIATFLTCSFCSSGQDKINRDSLLLYDLFNCNYNLTIKDLIKNGFEPTHDYPDQLERKINDTTRVYYLCNMEYKLILSRTIVIILKQFDDNYIKQIVENNNGFIQTDLCLDGKEKHNFYVINSRSRLLFLCHYTKRGGQPRLDIFHDYPANIRGGVMKNHPIFKNR